MRISNIILTLAASAAFATAQSEATTPPVAAGDVQEAPAAAAPVLPTDPAVIKADTSFVFGFQLGQVFQQQVGSKGITLEDVTMESFMKGFEQSMSKKPLTKDEEEKLGAALQALDKILQERMAKSNATNEAAGQKFLEENKAKKGVIVTDSGLQYEILKEGKGPKYEGDGSDNPQFKVRYEGRLIDGKKFDGNLDAPEPATFTTQVIPGFREALMKMPTGSNWRLYIPSKLAYAEKGAGGVIPPGSTLIFDLELVEIGKAEAPEMPPGFGGGALGGQEAAPGQ